MNLNEEMVNMAWASMAEEIKPRFVDYIKSYFDGHHKVTSIVRHGELRLFYIYEEGDDYRHLNEVYSVGDNNAELFVAWKKVLDTPKRVTLNVAKGKTRLVQFFKNQGFSIKEINENGYFMERSINNG